MTASLAWLDSWGWLAVPAVPLLLAGLTIPRTTQRLAAKAAPWAALPAFVLIARRPSGAIVFDTLLLGSRFALDGTALAFLLFTAVLWTASGVFAHAYLASDPRRHRFMSFFLLTMSGNLGLTIAADIVVFYLLFAMMTFAAYGLVVHDGSAAALRAGRVYLVMAVLGEAFLLAALLMGVQAAGGARFDELAAIAHAPHAALIMGLALAGFGVKAGAMPLHVWLPLAHPVAPTPASAVLSGAMIKAGLLGWLRFLPVGVEAFPGWGAVCLAAGVTAAILAAVIGALQDDTKTVLAYSSISQMGWMTAGVGVALASPEHAIAAVAAVIVFAAHHAFAKAALFLGTGVAAVAADTRRTRWCVGAGLLLPALALAGAPLTSGAVAKYQLIRVGTAWPWPAWTEAMLLVGAVGTSLLMTRFLILVRGARAEHGARPLSPGLWLPWVALIGIVAGFAPAVDVATPDPLPWLPAASGALLSALWPIAAGAGIAWLAARSRLTRSPPRVPPGDLLVPVARAVARGLAALDSLAAWTGASTSRARGRLGAAARKVWRALPLERAENALEPWLVIGTLFLLMAALLFGRLTVL